MRNREYKGWRITFDEQRPVTSTWRAERFGVGMCNNSCEALMNMIDVREQEHRETQKLRYDKRPAMR